MSVALINRIARPAQSASRVPTRLAARLAARQQRRLLAERDQLTARLAELHCMRALLRDAITVVSSGWVQHDWFVVAGDQGNPVRVSAHTIHSMTGRPVIGACLVGAIVHAGGGPAAARSQLVQRTLDLTWHALSEDQDRAVQWCPAPTIRTAHVRDLTRWNDQHGRQAGEVLALLQSAVGTTYAQTDRIHDTLTRDSLLATGR